MDGTGRLFQPLEASIGKQARSTTVSYPTTEPLGYDALLEVVEASLPEEPFVLVAESFSGPLAIRLAAENPRLLRGLVLCNTFVTSPFPPSLLRCCSTMAWLLFLPTPAFLIRWFLLGRGAATHLVARTRTTIASVRLAVLATRLREIASVDVPRALARIDVPVLYLAGSQDRLLSVRGMRSIKDASRDVEIETIQGPHLLLQACPEEAAGKILGFCERVGSGIRRRS